MKLKKDLKKLEIKAKGKYFINHTECQDKSRFLYNMLKIDEMIKKRKIQIEII